MIGRAWLKPAGVEAGESQNQQNCGACRGAAAVPDGVWSENQDLIQHSPPPFCLVIWSIFMRGGATQPICNEELGLDLMPEQTH